ncbi:MAG TPA: type II secretion system protein GspL, partial [Verrucomicrobiae bacterium]|nr:type II secretion system protein GspL [Verrucomicrobiae bacterium]
LAADAAERPRPDRVILAPGASHFFSREVALPLQDRRKVREILPLELKGATACDTDELVFEALPCGEGKVLALWARKREVAAQVALLAEAGLDPQVVSPSATAWGMLLTTSSPAVVTDGTALALFRDRSLLRLHPLDPVDPAADIRRTRAALELGMELQELPVWRIGNFPGGEEIEPLPMGVEGSEAFPDAEAFSAGAGAFALVLADLPGNGINFRRGELAYTGDREALRRKLRFSGALAALFVLLLAADCGLRYHLAQRDLASLDATVSSLYRDIFPNRRKGPDPVGEVKAELKRLSLAAGGGARLLPALKGAAEIKGEGIPGFYEVELEGTQVRLKGEASSLQGVNDLKARAAGRFSQAEVTETKSRPDGTVSFSLRGTLQEGR